MLTTLFQNLDTKTTFCCIRTLFRDWSPREKCSECVWS